MEQLELFEGMQPIKLLHTWEEKRRRALLHGAGNLAKPGREEIADCPAAACERFMRHPSVPATPGPNRRGGRGG